MRNSNLRTRKEFNDRNSVLNKIQRIQLSNINTKNERGNKMKHYFLRNAAKQKLMAIAISVLLLSFSAAGCGDSNVAGINDQEHKITSSGEALTPEKQVSSGIKLSLNLMYKSKSINESRMLESNNGPEFNHIVSVDSEIKPYEEIDLQELQPYGIFALYLCGTEEFSLTNSDGMSLRSKSILLEKCSFIDLKLKNNGANTIHVTGFVAGE